MTCPAGITRHLTARNAVIFGASCGNCPLRGRCTTAKDGRTLHLHEHDGLLRAARADRAAGPGLREDYTTHRPHVERAIAQVATSRGRRLKLRYRGVTRNHAWLKRRTAAVNLRNLLGKGLAAMAPGSWSPDQAARTRACDGDPAGRPAARPAGPGLAPGPAGQAQPDDSIIMRYTRSPEIAQFSRLLGARQADASFYGGGRNTLMEARPAGRSVLAR